MKCCPVVKFQLWGQKPEARLPQSLYKNIIERVWSSSVSFTTFQLGWKTPLLNMLKYNLLQDIQSQEKCLWVTKRRVISPVKWFSKMSHCLLAFPHQAQKRAATSRLLKSAQHLHSQKKCKHKEFSSFLECPVRSHLPHWAASKCISKQNSCNFQRIRALTSPWIIWLWNPWSAEIELRWLLKVYYTCNAFLMQNN